MGIRFRCPNGHKLNVKSYLAGKRGVCPHCGVKVDIPSASQADGSAGDEPRLASAAVQRSPQPFVAARPNREQAAEHPSLPTESAPQSWSKEDAPVAAPAPEGLTLQTGNLDPIAESPHAVWYVRPPTGGQYGPAPADIMRKWVREGRVSDDSLVWREGWPDWRLAAGMFVSGMASNAAATPPATTPAAVAPQTTAPANVRATTTPTAAAPASAGRRRRSNTLPIVAVVALSVLTLALLGVLFWVLQRQG